MSNMSYCRFRNTDADLGDCQDALEGLLNADPEMEPLSPTELEAAQSLVRRCLDVVHLVAEQLSLDVEDLDQRRETVDKFFAEANSELRNEDEDEDEDDEVVGDDHATA